MGLTGNRRFQVIDSGTDWQTSSWIANFFKVLQVPVGMTGLTFSSGTKHSGNIVIAFNVSFGGEVQVTTICLGLARKCIFQILLSF